MDDEARESITRLRLRCKASRALIRELHAATAEVERQLTRLESQSPKEAERESEDIEEILYERCVA